MTLLPRAITGGETTLLQSDRQFSQVYATFHVPHIIYIANLAAVPSSTDAVLSVTYNSGAGISSNILNDMTVYVGTSSGAYDLGMVRIRDITGIGSSSGTFNIGETSAVNWQPGCYLTVVDEFAIWPRNIRLQGTTPYIDEIAYTDQNSKPDSIPCFGSHRVFWYTGLDITTSWDARDSWAITNSITGYSWTAPGSVTSSGMTTSTPTIVFHDIGTYRVSCTVTNSDGKSFTGYRYVFVVAEGNGATSAMTLNSMDGSQSEGGWKANITLFDEASLSLIRDRALCILHTIDYYGDTKTSLGFAGGEENVLMVGWISLENIEEPSQGFGGSVTFDIYTAHYWLNQITAFPAGLKDRTTTPTKWTRWNGLSSQSATWHQWHWRSTLDRCTDVFPMQNTVRASRIEAPGAQTLWEQTKTMQWNYVRGLPCCDRLSRVHNQIEQQILTTSQRASVVTVGSITDSDWEGTINFNRIVATPVSLTDLSGVGWDGSNATALAAYSPGKVFRNYGRADVVDRLVLNDISSTITLCGLWDGWKNNQFPMFTASLPGNNRFVDIAPYTYWNFTIDATRNPRGIAYSGRVIPRSVKYNHTESGCIETIVDFEAETFASLAVENVQPTVTIPPVIPPPPPPPPPIIPPSITTNLLGFAMFVTGQSGGGSYIIYSGFNIAGQPVWTNLALPPHWSGLMPLSDRWDTAVSIPPDGSRFMIAGTRSTDGKPTIYECTNWLSIRDNPTPPAPVWAEQVVYGVTSIGGGAVTNVSTGSSCQGEFDASNNFRFTCKVGGVWSIGSIAPGGALSSTSPTISNGNCVGIGVDCYNDQSLVNGTSFLRNYAGTPLSTWSGSQFGSQEYCQPYRNTIGGGAVTAYDRIASPANQLSVRTPGGFFDMGTNTSAGVTFGGTPRSTIAFVSTSALAQSWKSSDGGNSWAPWASWGYGKIIGTRADADTGGVWARYDTITSGNVPVRLYDAAGNVVNDLTGNWWTTGPAHAESNTTILSFRGWYLS